MVQQNLSDKKRLWSVKYDLSNPVVSIVASTTADGTTVGIVLMKFALWTER